VAQVTVLLTNATDFAGMNESYAEVFTTESPARAVAKLGVDLPNVLVSIMMTAHIAE
jgi:2-iminobutanoate/2-iminopropanoate deaminase